MKSRTILFILFIVCMAPSTEAASAVSHKIGQTYNIFRENISVSAKLTEAIKSPDDPPFYAFILIIGDAHRRYEVKTEIIVVENFDDALGVLKNSINSKDGYTFVRHECGGGNGWRCNVDSIFIIKDGTLQWVGDMAGAEDRGAVGHNYSGGLFMDIYNKFESNRLTSHADAPFFMIYSRDNK